ncbi:unnamed protein product [Linum trigynum]|uniref:Uncharacterized protein n=1 Tax=Linum trigynum TaxID=586398 RepID=A0AAV2CTS7_9ROSI
MARSAIRDSTAWKTRFAHFLVRWRLRRLWGSAVDASREIWKLLHFGEVCRDRFGVFPTLPQIEARALHVPDPRRTSSSVTAKASLMVMGMRSSSELASRWVSRMDILIGKESKRSDWEGRRDLDEGRWPDRRRLWQREDGFFLISFFK